MHRMFDVRALSIFLISSLLLVCFVTPVALADIGPEWEQIDVPTEILKITDVSGNTGPLGRGLLFAVTTDGLLRTHDGGKTWQESTQDIFDSAIISLVTVGSPPTQQGDIPAHLRVLSSSGELYTSFDGGETWSDLGSVTDQPVSGLAMAMGDSIMYLFAADSQSVYQDSASGQWQGESTGLDENSITALWSHPDTYYDVVAASGSHLHLLLGPTKPDYQRHWVRLTDAPLLGKAVSLSTDPLDENSVLVGTEQGGVYSVDLVTRKVADYSGSLPGHLDVLDVTRVVGPNGPWLVVATSGGVYRTGDQGHSWIISGPDAITDGGVTCLAVDDNAPSMLLIGTESHGIVRANMLPNHGPARPWAVVMVTVGLLGLLGIAVVSTIKATKPWQNRSAQRGLQLDQWQAWNEQIGHELQHNLQVTDAVLEDIPSQLRTLAMRRYVDTHHHQALILTQEPLAIAPARRIELDILANTWQSLLNSLPAMDNASAIAGHIIDQVCAILGFTPTHRQTYRSVVGVMAEAPSIRLSLPRRFPIMFVLHPEPSAADVRDMRDMARMLGAMSFFALVIVLNAVPNSPEEKQALMATVRSDADDFEVIDYEDLVQLYLASDPSHELARIILTQIDIRMVSPYVMWGPVPDNMFFGRHYEINAILQTLSHRSIALIGGRKIGKTSILAQIEKLAQETATLSVLRIDCQHVGDYHAFYEALALTTGSVISEETITGLRRALVGLRRSQTDTTTVIILDEVGRLLSYDAQRNMQLFRAFDALAQEGLVRFLFCGERLLDRALYDPTSRLYRAWDAVRLGYLAPEAVKRIATEPMRNLGLELEDSDAIARGIAEMSACHPNLVQYICQQLILSACARDSHIVHLDDLDHIWTSPEYREFLFEIIWGDATTLEKLVTVAMAGKRRFTRDEVALALQRLGCVILGDLLDECLYQLVLLAIFGRDQDRYTYNAGALARVLHEADLKQVFIDSLTTALEQETS